MLGLAQEVSTHRGLTLNNIGCRLDVRLWRVEMRLRVSFIHADWGLHLNVWLASETGVRTRLHLSLGGLLTIMWRFRQ